MILLAYFLADLQTYWTSLSLNIVLTNCANFNFRKIVQHKRTTETSPQFVLSCLENAKEKVRNSNKSIIEFSELKLLSQCCS